jgi:hypothetical protein
VVVVAAVRPDRKAYMYQAKQHVIEVTTQEEEEDMATCRRSTAMKSMSALLRRHALLAFGCIQGALSWAPEAESKETSGL